jgi:Mor family transcriptional regulator
MEDKMGRLRTLIKSEAKVKDENISDTLRDLSNYALMASVWFDNKDVIDRFKGLALEGLTEFTNQTRPSKPAGEIEIQNAEQLRLYLNIHKEKGAVSVATGIGRDLFYRIDFTEFYRYIKELRGLSFDESDKFEIYFNVRNDELNKKIYVRTNDTYNTYMFHDIKSFETAINQFIAYKQYLLDKAHHPHNIKSLIQVDSDRQNSNILKPRARIDTAFIKLMLSDYNDVKYYISHSDSVEEYLNKQFIYDMFEGTTDPKYGKYYTVLSEKYGLSMISTVETTLERFLSKTFLDSFQRKLDAGCRVKLVKIPQ